MNKVFVIAIVAVLILAAGAWFVIHQHTISAVNTEVEAANPLRPGGEEQPDLSAAAEGGVSGGVENTAVFSCSGGKQMTVVFTNNLAGVTLSDGRSMTLHQAVSGSGIRYLSNDEKVELRGKGKEGSLSENGVQTYSGCVANN